MSPTILIILVAVVLILLVLDLSYGNPTPKNQESTSPDEFFDKIEDFRNDFN